MTVERFQPSGTTGDCMVAESEALQILEAWVNESAAYSPTHPLPMVLVTLLGHWGCTFERYPGSDAPGYVGPTYQVVKL